MLPRSEFMQRWLDGGCLKWHVKSFTIVDSCYQLLDGTEGYSVRGS